MSRPPAGSPAPVTAAPDDRQTWLSTSADATMPLPTVSDSRTPWCETPTHARSMTFTDALAGLVAIVASIAGSAAGSAAASVAGSPAESAAHSAAQPAARGPGWLWPLEPRPAVVRPFDPPDQPWASGHRGVDLRAEVGRAVRSPADGTVTFAGVLAGRGVVVVLHDHGLRSTFEPVEGGPPVGTRVVAGATVGRVSAQPGHCIPATCLHWGVLRGSSYLDPLSMLQWAPVVLLPLP